MSLVNSSPFCLSYSSMPARIEELCPGMGPGIVLTDLHRAYKKHFPNSAVHLSQNFQKKLGEVALKVRS